MRLSISLLFVTFTSLALACLPAVGQSSTALPAEIDSVVRARVAGAIYPGLVIGIVNADGPQYYAFGGVSFNSETRPDERTIYEIGSITKTFTAALLAIAASEGDMQLDDPISKYLPKTVTVPMKNDTPITLEHLATHTSGLPRLPDNLNPADPGNPYADYGEQSLYDFLSSHSLRRAPGAAYEYSNYATGLLGYILAEYAGTSFENLIVEKIANPLGMNDTRMTLTPGMRTRLAPGTANGNEVANWDFQTLAAAGALRSSMHDLLRYVASNMGLHTSPLTEILQSTHKQRHSDGNTQIGLGWHIRNRENGVILMHNGGTGGYRSFAGFLSDGSLGVAVLTNSTTSVDDIGFRLLDPTIPLASPKQSIAAAIAKVIKTNGIEVAAAEYRKLKSSHAHEYIFAENELNALGYRYLSAGDIPTAIAVFKLNAEAYPDASNVYDSLGEAYMKNGNDKLAIENYTKSLELNPGNDNARAMLTKLGVAEPQAEEVVVAPETLQSYVGVYQLAPGFTLTVTAGDTNAPLMVEATGQNKFPIFPMTQTKFYYKVVNAQITFSVNAMGIVESLTLHQNGRDIPGNKIE